MESERWHDCYSVSRKDLFTQESNRHPAKMAVGLCFRIFEHGERMGYWKKGDLILDPMAGIGTTLICGAWLGYRVLGIELEQHFVDLAWGNIVASAERLCRDGINGCGKYFLPTKRVPPFGIIGADARDLQKVLCDATITSPSYADQELTGEGHFRSAREPNQAPARENPHEGYAAVVSSPPYGDAAVPSSVPFSIRVLAREGRWDEAMAEMKKWDEAQIASGAIRAHRTETSLRQHIERALEADAGNYGARAPQALVPSEAEGVVSSPPYMMPEGGGKGIASIGHYLDPDLAKRQYVPEQFSRDGAQIGNLRDPDGDINRLLDDSLESFTREGSETYLEAMWEVYRQVHAVLKPGGVVCLVTKNPVRGGKLRRLDLDTIQLMEAAGFCFLERQMAMLASEHGTQLALDGSETTKRVERKSFFKRLFEKKYPHLAVDHEDVLWFRKV
jgi:hypothetical protein